ncbi:MAG: hypothetical protein VX473_00715 [Candidatus Thermoplasmatota archaeon]|nr:hypothetical protein [Candidatus Thermoplasmatota archaeon]
MQPGQGIPAGNVVTGQPAQYVVAGGNPMMMGGMFPSTNAMVALILACLSFVSCGCFMSIPALILAQGALQITESMPGHPDQGQAKAAQVVAWVNIAFSIVGALLYMVLIVWAVGLESEYGY